MMNNCQCARKTCRLHSVLYYRPVHKGVPVLCGAWSRHAVSRMWYVMSNHVWVCASDEDTDTLPYHIDCGGF